MTAIEIAYRFRGPLLPTQLRSLSDAFSVYGVRAMRVDEAASKLTIEYDATRLREAEVEAIVRRSGIQIEN